jgi:hypothetical protein
MTFINRLRGPWPTLALFAIVLLAYAPVLDELASLLRLGHLAASTGDTATHFLRMLHARDLYLPSGHHFGWEPYWFQGYVPFLLYPHLMYVALALVSIVLSADPERVFNSYTVLILFALPLFPALAVLRHRGLGPAALCAWWLASLSTVGAGLWALFGTGLIAQHTGVVMFAILAFDLIVARRLDRAAIWLGLIPLLHVHTSLAAAFLWSAAGMLAMTERRDAGQDPAMRGSKARTWLVSSMLAAVIALPTLIGLVHGRSHVGDSTGFAFRRSVLVETLMGNLVAPWPILGAISCVLLAALVTIRPKRREIVVWSAVAITLFVAAFDAWTIGITGIDRVLDTMLYLRTLPYAFVVAAILAVSCWNDVSTNVRRTALALSVLGVAGIWASAYRYDARIGKIWPASSRWTADNVADYSTILRSIAWDVREDTATVAAALPKPHGPMMVTTVRRLHQPLLYGHGIELTDVRNAKLVSHGKGQSCEAILQQVESYAVGYLVGSDPDYRSHLEKCLHRPPSAEAGAWWMFATGRRWSELGGHTGRFRRNETWTALEWELRESENPRNLRLPMANTAPWAAEIDGTPVVIETTNDGMMAVEVLPRSKTLRMRYAGFAGEWESVVAAAIALWLAIKRTRRRG